MKPSGRSVRSFLLRYGFSVVVYFVAVVLTHLLWPYIQPAPVPLFFAAIVSAFWGGFGPGVFVSLISALTIDYFFVIPYGHFEWSSPNLVRMGVFSTVSVLVSWLNGTRKRLMDERGRLLRQIESFNTQLQLEVKAATQELVQANDALLKTQQHLARSERLAVVGQLAASLAHEVGTPLNAISGHLELLAEETSSNADTNRRIRIIRQQLDFIVTTVRRLLEWTHKRGMIFESVDINKLINEVLWLVRPTLEKHSITAKLRTTDRLFTIEANRESLQQVLLNLINNSIEAMPQGGHIDIRTEALPLNGTFEITFHDSGPGIRPEDVVHLFEPMWTTKPSGTGLGLALAREIIDEHAGEIRVGGGRGSGATFTITLPISRAKHVVDVREKAHVA